jgi:hypothetical protein
LSGDGVLWRAVGEPLSPADGQWQHYKADFDALLRGEDRPGAAPIVLDGNVYVMFRHFGAQANDGVYLDDVQVSTMDLFGPLVVSLARSGGSTDPLGEVVVTFDEPINDESFTAGDVSIVSPTGDTIMATEVAAVSQDHRAYFVRFAAQSIPGAYSFTIGPAIEDANDNPMASASSIGGDPFQGATHVAASPMAVPLCLMNSRSTRLRSPRSPAGPLRREAEAGRSHRPAEAAPDCNCGRCPVRTASEGTTRCLPWRCPILRRAYWG